MADKYYLNLKWNAKRIQAIRFLHIPLPRGGGKVRGAHGGMSNYKMSCKSKARKISQRRLVIMLQVAATF